MCLYVFESLVEKPQWNSNPDLMKSSDVESNAITTGPQTQQTVHVNTKVCHLPAHSAGLHMHLLKVSSSSHMYIRKLTPSDSRPSASTSWLIGSVNEDIRPSGSTSWLKCAVNEDSRPSASTSWLKGSVNEEG